MPRAVSPVTPLLDQESSKRFSHDGPNPFNNLAVPTPACEGDDEGSQHVDKNQHTTRDGRRSPMRMRNLFCGGGENTYEARCCAETGKQLPACGVSGGGGAKIGPAVSMPCEAVTLDGRICTQEQNLMDKHASFKFNVETIDSSSTALRFPSLSDAALSVGGSRVGSGSAEGGAGETSPSEGGGRKCPDECDVNEGEFHPCIHPTGHEPRSFWRENRDLDDYEGDGSEDGDRWYYRACRRNREGETLF